MLFALRFKECVARVHSIVIRMNSLRMAIFIFIALISMYAYFPNVPFNTSQAHKARIKESKGKQYSYTNNMSQPN